MHLTRHFDYTVSADQQYPFTNAYLAAADFCRSQGMPDYQDELDISNIKATAARLQEIESLGDPDSPLKIPGDFLPREAVQFLFHAYKEVQKTAKDLAAPAPKELKILQSDVLGKLIQQATKWNLHFTYRPLDPSKAANAKPLIQKQWLELDGISQKNSFIINIRPNRQLPAGMHWYRPALDGVKNYLYANPQAFRVADAMNIVDFLSWSQEAYAFGFNRCYGDRLEYLASTKKIMTAFAQTAGHFSKAIENNDPAAAKAIGAFGEAVAKMAVSMEHHPALAAPLTDLEAEKGIPMCWSCLNITAVPKLASS